MYPSKATEAASAVLFQRRQEAQQQALDRRSEIYARHPEFRSFDRQIQGLAGGIAAAALSPDGPARVVSAALPCRYDPADGHCHWDEGSDASLQAFFNAAASADASGAQASSGSAPYPSTSVPPGQPSRPAR